MSEDSFASRSEASQPSSQLSQGQSNIVQFLRDFYSTYPSKQHHTVHTKRFTNNIRIPALILSVTDAVEKPKRKQSPGGGSATYTSQWISVYWGDVSKCLGAKSGKLDIPAIDLNSKIQVGYRY